jgi:hypothetical protein
MVAAMIARVLVLLMVLTAPAAADDRIFGAEATIGVYDGFGVGIKVGDSHVGVHVIGAWQPLIVSASGTASDPTPKIDVYSTLQANADIYLLFSEPTPRSAVGVTAGYKGSNILGHGGGIGFYATIDAHKRVSYFIMAGITWFPSGDDRLREKKNYPADYDFSFPGPAFNTGANVGIVFSP